MESDGGLRALVRAAVGDVRDRPVLVGAAALVMVATGLLSVVVLAVAYAAYEPDGFLSAGRVSVFAVAAVGALSAFALGDLFLVHAAAADRGFAVRDGLTAFASNPWTVVLWVVTFGLVLSPLRLLASPLEWSWVVVPFLSTPREVAGYLAVRAAVVAVLVGVTYFVPVLVVEGTSPSRAARENVRLLRAAPRESAGAVVASVAVVVTAWFVLFAGGGLLVVALGLGWIGVGPVGLPVALAVLLIGLVALPVTYAVARALTVRVYRLAGDRLEDGRPAAA